MPGELINSAEAVIATFICLYLGIFTPSLIAGKFVSRLTILMAVASGIMCWSFIDIMNDAALIGVNQGFSLTLVHVLLPGLFAVVVLFLFWLDRLSTSTGRRRGHGIMLSYGTALLVALGIGFHSLGEGVEVGSLIGYSYALAGASSNLIRAIGGLASGLAYLMHKFLEGFVIGIFAAAVKARLVRNFYLGLLAGLPTAIGLTIALFVPIDSTIFFAGGAAAVIYILYKLVSNLFSQSHRPRYDDFFYILFFLLGFYLMYFAGLFHSYTTIF
jgi:zinc transporter, ZIP family